MGGMLYVEMVMQILESEKVSKVRQIIMKTLNDYMAMSYRMEIVEDKDEGGFVISYPDLPGCITCGETIEAAVANALDAKKAWIEAAIKDGIKICEPDNLEAYSGQFKLRIPRSLHRSLAEHSKREGISMNQYCMYLLSKNDAVDNLANL
jgi:predicted RNase H-like HicB family nuclease